MINERSDTLKNVGKGEDSSSSIFLNSGVRKSKELTPEQMIEALLKERNLKKSDLASMIGIQRQSLNHYLHGFWNIPVSIKLKIAKALEVDSSIIWSLEK